MASKLEMDGSKIENMKVLSKHKFSIRNLQPKLMQMSPSIFKMVRIEEILEDLLSRKEYNLQSVIEEQIMRKQRSKKR